MTKLYLLLVLLISSGFLNAQIGNLDPSFGDDGIEKIKYLAKGTLITEEGESYRIEELGEAYEPSVKVYKYLSNGLPDLSFGTQGFTDPITMKYFSSAIQDDGKIVVVGTMSRPFSRSLNDHILAVRFNADGSLDYTYSSDQPARGYTYPTS
jgi:hypothetical protein